MIFLSHHQTLILLFSPMTQIFCSPTETPANCKKNINHELMNISNWFKLNKLSLNIDKTNFMIFKNKHSNKPDLNFKIEIY